MKASDTRNKFNGRIDALFLSAPQTSTIIREQHPDAWRMRNGYRTLNAWCVVHPMRSNGYSFALQWVRGVAGGPRVRAGCRFKTLPQAWSYIQKRKRSYNRNKYLQAESIIRLLLLRAQAEHDLPGVKGLKFDNSLTKPKRK